MDLWLLFERTKVGDGDLFDMHGHNLVYVAETVLHPHGAPILVALC